MGQQTEKMRDIRLPSAALRPMRMHCDMLVHGMQAELEGQTAASRGFCTSLLRWCCCECMYKLAGAARTTVTNSERSAVATRGGKAEGFGRKKGLSLHHNSL